MKIIKVLQKVANGEIEKGTKFILNDNLFIFNGRLFESNDSTYLENCIFLNEKDLNKEVELIPPKLKKYYLRLHGGTSNFEDYVNRHKENFGLHSYIIDDDEECNGFYTKFTQDEIDNDVLLKFIEQHGIKEEATEDEND